MKGDRDRSEKAWPLNACWPNNDLIGGDKITTLEPFLNDGSNYRPCGGDAAADHDGFRIDAVN